MLDRVEVLGQQSEDVMDVELNSVTLARLVEEVRTASVEPSAYNRMHNRHNRS